jgi:ribosomal protein S18 acetylase RimI-like enzyme
LLDLAKTGSGGRLWLYTFVTNTRAQRFYERHGFDVVERGFEPVMQLGDLRYEWRRPGR